MGCKGISATRAGPDGRKYNGFLRWWATQKNRLKGGAPDTHKLLVIRSNPIGTTTHKRLIPTLSALGVDVRVFRDIALVTT